MKNDDKLQKLKRTFENFQSTISPHELHRNKTAANQLLLLEKILNSILKLSDEKTNKNS